MLLIILAALALYSGVGVYQTCLKPLPKNVSLEGEVRPIAGADVEFLFDTTGMKGGKRVSEQMIFDHVLELIRGAENFVLVDLFLFNDYLGKDRTVHRKLCEEVTRGLLERKRSNPDIHLVVITDPVNEVYGGIAPEPLRRLRAAGIPVVVTDLRKLRDSNPLYSSFWRICVQWFGASATGPMPHPFSQEASGVSVRSWLALMNFKANHRKLVIADTAARTGGREMACVVMSANPHDASSAHGNIGLLARGGLWRDLMRGEQAILTFSGAGIDLAAWLPTYAVSEPPGSAREPKSGATAQVLTEAKIRKHLLEAVESTDGKDSIDIGMFYLSERAVLKALIDAAQRGVSIRVLLDPNRDAFGYQKNGIPNRPVAAELIKRGGGKILVRWYNTHGEQFHTKLVLVRHEGQATLFVGSANLTRRNIGDFNLETDIVLRGAQDLAAVRAAEEYFEKLWTNRDLDCSVPYETFAETSRLKNWLYRFQEWSGTSTF